MKFISELKNKSFKVERTYNYPNIDYLIDRFIKRLQPEEYEKPYFYTNDINTKIENGKITFSCKKFYFLYGGDNDIESVKKHFNDCNYKKVYFIEYFEKINRSLYILEDFKISLKMPSLYKEIRLGTLTFRSNDYYFIPDNSNKKIFGEKISTENIILDNNKNIIGIKCIDFEKNSIEYKFI